MVAEQVAQAYEYVASLQQERALQAADQEAQRLIGAHAERLGVALDGDAVRQGRTRSFCRLRTARDRLARLSG
jgi:hypothetical protein